MASASAQWLEQPRLDFPAKRANQRSRWLRETLFALPVEGRERASLLGLRGELQISGSGKRGRLSKPELVEKVLNEFLEQLPVASASTTAPSTSASSKRFNDFILISEDGAGGATTTASGGTGSVVES